MREREEKMKLNVLTPEHPDIPAVKALYEQAFPANERGMSMDAIVANMDKMPIRLFGIYTDEAEKDFAGFLLAIEGEKFVYLVFLAILPEKRSGGLGSQVLNAMREYYAGTPLVFSYESIYEESDNAEQRERRRNLYLKLGFHETGWFAKLNGTEFIIASSEPEIDADVFMQYMRAMAAGNPDAKIPELYRRD